MARYVSDEASCSDSPSCIEMLSSAQWIDRLCGLESCTPFARQLLHLVRTGMLVADPSSRLSIDLISIEINTILDSLLEPQTAEQASPALVHDAEPALQAESNDVGGYQPVNSKQWTNAPTDRG